jgi:hypothetical protein
MRRRACCSVRYAVANIVDIDPRLVRRSRALFVLARMTLVAFVTVSPQLQSLAIDLPPSVVDAPPLPSSSDIDVRHRLSRARPRYLTDSITQHDHKQRVRKLKHRSLIASAKGDYVHQRLSLHIVVVLLVFSTQTKMTSHACAALSSSTTTTTTTMPSTLSLSTNNASTLVSSSSSIVGNAANVSNLSTSARYILCRPQYRCNVTLTHCVSV